MKKCNFFSVLVVALFVFCGFDSTAQTYKPVNEALAIVQTVMDAAEHDITANGGTGTTVSSSTSNSVQMVLRAEIGKVLLVRIKQSQDVGKSLQDLYAQRVNAANPRTNVAKAALDHYKNLLLI